MDAGSIWIRLGLNADELRFGLDKAKYGMLEWRGQTNQNTMEMAKWGAAITAEVAPAVAIGAAILDATSKAGAFGKVIKDNARDLGLTTDEYQQWQHAITAAGGAPEAMTESVRMMTVRMKEAVDPTSDMGKQFAALSVNVTDSAGNMRSTNDVLLDTFAALNQLPEGFARNQAQMQIFGRGFSNISDLAGKSRAEIQALLNQAPIIDSEKIARMDEFNTKLALVNEQWKLMYAEIGTELIPVVETLMPLISDYGIPAIGGLADVLQYAGRGFHIMGAEAKAAYDLIINHDIGAAKQDLVDLATWIQSTQTADALKLAGYTEGAFWDGSKWVKPTKPGGKAPEVTDTAAQKTAEQAEKDRVSALTDAWKEYQDQIKKVADETDKLNDINKDFARELSVLNPRDVSAARNLIIQHKFDVEDQNTAMLESIRGLKAPAIEYNAIKTGTPLEQVKGTTQYTEAQAKASGPLPEGPVTPYTPSPATPLTGSEKVSVQVTVPEPLQPVPPVIVHQPVAGQQSTGTPERIETPASIPIPLPVTIVSQPKPAEPVPPALITRPPAEQGKEVPRYPTETPAKVPEPLPAPYVLQVKLAEPLPAPFISQAAKERSQEPLPGISAAQQTMIKSGDLHIYLPNGVKIGSVPGVVTTAGKMNLTQRGIS